MNISTHRLLDLNASGNKIHYIPLEIFQVTSIEKIQMQGNKITSLKPADNLSRTGDLGKLVQYVWLL